jgi:hypothetical protein
VRKFDRVRGNRGLAGRTDFTHPTGFANANAPLSFTFNAGMDQPRAVDGDEIEGELLSEVDS